MMVLSVLEMHWLELRTSGLQRRREVTGRGWNTPL
jgi:hypothetical protein